MQIIKWVVTPPCRLCSAPPEFKRRRSCFGCEKFHRKKPAPPVFRSHRLSKEQMRQRNARIAALRAEGLSYEKIARIMKMPRATVQSAAAAALREQKKN